MQLLQEAWQISYFRRRQGSTRASLNSLPCPTLNPQPWPRGRCEPQHKPDRARERVERSKNGKSRLSGQSPINDDTGLKPRACWQLCSSIPNPSARAFCLKKSSQASRRTASTTAEVDEISSYLEGIMRSRIGASRQGAHFCPLPISTPGLTAQSYPPCSILVTKEPDIGPQRTRHENRTRQDQVKGRSSLPLLFLCRGPVP